MIFSTHLFIFLFLPGTLFGFYLLNRFGLLLLSKWWLVMCSLFFYWYGAKTFFPFFVLSVLFNYIVGYILSHFHSKGYKYRGYLVLFIGILANCFLLGYYKYTNFFIDNINFFTDNNIAHLDIILPIGISFFTFQLIAYLVDSHRGETLEYKFINYLLFITFFPQLIVGPIVHHKDVNFQYEREQTYMFNLENFNIGLFLFFMGAAKKLLLADAITPIVAQAFNNTANLNIIDAWLASVGFTISYYFDLSGYADMAIGLGLLFNIKIPINFNSPYKATNFADYWRRWHITLSRFLGDYIFRNIKKKGGSSFNFYFAIFITFLVSGFWHGAGWTFVLWGVLNGVFVIISHMLDRAKIKINKFIAWFVTFLGVVGVRILFVSKTFSDSINVYRSLFDIHSIKQPSLYLNKELLIPIIVGLVIALFFPNSNELREKFQPNFKYVLITASSIILSLIFLDRVGAFLYFQF